MILAAVNIYINLWRMKFLSILSKNTQFIPYTKTMANVT